MSYKKVGGLHFVRVGRFGFSFFWSAKARVPRTPRRVIARLERDIEDAVHATYFAR